MTHLRFQHAIVSLTLVTAMACGSPTSPAESTTFQGVIAGSGNQTGTVTITVQTQVAAAASLFSWWPLVATLHAQTSVTAIGTVHVAGGATTSVTGTFDSTSKALTLSGGGFAFTGSVSGSALTGTYSGPNGVTGNFSTRNSTVGTVTSYCGNVFGAGAPGVITGVFNMAVSTATGGVSGAFSIFGSNSGSITGQVTGTALTISIFDATGPQGTATGTVQNGSVSGVSASNNTFSGTTSACQ